MKRLLLSAVLMCSISITGFAQDEEFRGGGLTAPSVNGKANWGNALKGDIILDQSDNNFYGLDDSGTWRNISAVSTPASASSSGYVNTTTQTFGGNKTFNGSITPAGGIVGDTSGTAAGTGYVGEKLANSGAATSIAASTGGYQLRSLTLTPGVWLIWADFTIGASVNGAGTRTLTGIGTTSASFATTLCQADTVVVPTSAANVINQCMAYLNISATTTYYANALMVYSSGTYSGNATMHAVRIR